MLTRPEAPHVLAVSSAAALAACRDPANNLAIWARPVPAALRREARGLLLRAPFEIRLTSRPACLGARLAAALPAPAPHLLADVVRLAAAFAAIAGCSVTQARLEALTDEACVLFHADHVGLRLLCTYVGAGTEWIPEAALDRSGLCRGDNRLVLRRAGTIRRLPECAVGLLKGEAFPGNRGRGLVHRSPPASSLSPRLLLCLDEPGRP